MIKLDFFFRKTMFMLLFILCFIFCDCVSLPKKATVRELELYIIDNDTNEPIPNIVVFYELVKSSPVFFIEVRYTTIDKKMLVSDENGRIVLPNRSFIFGYFQNLLNESFCINIDFTDEYKSYYEKVIYKFNIHDQTFKYFNALYFSKGTEEARQTRDKNRENGVFFINNNYYPAFIVLFDIEGSYIYRQETNLENIEYAVENYDIGSTLGTSEKQKITIKLIRKRN